MAAITGVAGACTLATVAVEITKWSLKTSKPVENVNDSTTGNYEDNLSTGYKRFEGSLEGYIKSGVDIPDEGDTGALVLTLASGKTFTGSAIISDVSYDVPIKEGSPATFTCSFVGTSTLTKPTF